MPRTCPAQGTLEDYARADALRERTRGKVFGGRVEPHWFADGDRFWYRSDRADGAREFIVVDAVAGTRRPAFDHARLAAALTRATEKPHEATRLPFERIEIAEDGSIRFEARRQALALRPRRPTPSGQASRSRQLPTPARRPRPGPPVRGDRRGATESPDGK